MANPQQAPPPGQTYQLPPNSLAGHIGMGRSNPGGRSTTDHKLNMGFLMDNPGKAQYNTWWNIVNDLMIARNFVPGATAMNYPDANFQPIFAGMRRLRPVCYQLARASAANNQQRMQDIDEAVVHIVKDCARKLFNTWMTHPHAPPQGQPGVCFAQVIVPGVLLSTNNPAQWGLATALPNVAQAPALPAINQAQGPAPPAIDQAQAPAPPANNQAQAPASPAINQAQAPAPPVDDPASSVDDPTSRVDDPAPLVDDPAPVLDLPALPVNRLMADRMPTG